MRTIAAIVLFAAAGLSPASAQDARPQGSFSMDHGHASDAAAAARQAAAVANAKAAAIAAGVNPAPSNFTVNGDNVIRAAPELTPEQQKAEEQGRAAWLARCRPTVVEDSEGMRRTKYADAGCDLSRFNTAGQ